MDEKRPSDYMFQLINRNSILAFAEAKINLEEIILASMRQKMADHLVRANITRTETEYSVEHRLEVCVLTYDELTKLIHREAKRLAYRPFDLDLGK